MAQNDEDTGHTTPTEEPKAADTYITGTKRWLITTSVTLVMFLTILDTTIIVTAIPEITTEFSSLSDVGWYGSVYLIASCSLQPVTGKMYSNFSLKYTFLAFLIVFEVGSAVCGAAHSSGMLIAGRTVAGLGGSGLRNGALSIVSACIPLSERPVYFGIMMGLSMLGAVAGPLVGGAFTTSVSWRWCFYINLPIGAVASILLLCIQIPDKRTKLKTRLDALSKLDPIGFFLFVPVAVMLLMALEWGGSHYPWKSATIIGLLCGSVGMFAVFISWEYYRGDEAMIPLSLVRKRAVWSSCLAMWFMFGIMMVYSYYLPIYFQAVKGESAISSGVDILPLILGQLTASVVSGGLVRRVGYYLPFTIVCGILVTISAGLLSTLRVDTSTGKWIGYQILGGFGQGLGLQMPFIAVQHAVAEELNSVALALLVLMQQFGGAILLSIAETIFDTELTSGIQHYAPSVSAGAVKAAGAAGFREVVPPAQLDGVLRAYNSAVAKEFYLALASAAGSLIVCWGMGWVNTAKSKDKASTEEQVEKNSA